MTNEQLKGHLDLLLLQIIADEPVYGYQLACLLRDRSDGTFDLAEGTLYPALHRMERLGLVASEWDDSGPRRRRVYRMTANGRVALRDRRREWARFTGGVGAVLGSAT
jgi:DNA-binding PadR family transcriptional regulator